LKNAIVINFCLELNAAHGWTEIPFADEPHAAWWRIKRSFALLSRLKRIDAVFASNPNITDLAFMWAAKRLSRGRVHIFAFDVILRAPTTVSERIIARVRRRLLQAIDVIFCIHKDVSGYAACFGIDPEKCRYIPFKANNFDLAGLIPAHDGDYVLSLGASHRDYKTLIAAVRDTGLKTIVLLPRRSIQLHNAEISANLPSNVRHVDTEVSREEWSRYIAQSRIVVVPLLAGVIQPAGISVYLEAMVFGKPVVISRGPSTTGILDDTIAVLVTAGDPEELRSTLAALWHDADRRQSIGARAREYALSLGDHNRLVRDLRTDFLSYTS